ncbi:hypothetical protein SSPO_001310 [Streptomyces antimycoticus]|uniref:Uncharacterized protein n=1 Tax=Streptomyces antimycoticus TaxID=68175 RepID=A0A499UA98_9ACTN|nr:hypothetical protein [Streptomyces antimycoticus]BBJ37413.1 hypothetical protein SSPO_001310 [Streptomyces antimycoticus]
MTLIYAFKDSSGQWHGDPDLPLLDPADTPGRGMLTYQPVPGTPEADGPFAGQTLTVLYGVVDLESGPVTYQLDNGGRFLASWHIHALLAAPMGTAPLPADTPSTHAQPPCVETSFTKNGLRYILTGTRCDSGQLTMDLTVSTNRGDIQGELCGTITDNDLQPLAHLLETAFRTLAVTPPSVPQAFPGSAWRQQVSDRLADRFRQQRDFGVLAAEFGCSRAAIYEELKRRRLISAPSQQGSTQKRQAAPAVSPILQQRRLVHRNSHARWSEEDDERLRQRSAAGIMNPELSNEFGRSVEAINSRLRKIEATGPAADQARLNAF